MLPISQSTDHMSNGHPAEFQFSHNFSLVRIRMCHLAWCAQHSSLSLLSPQQTPTDGWLVCHQHPSTPGPSSPSAHKHQHIPFNLKSPVCPQTSTHSLQLNLNTSHPSAHKRQKIPFSLTSTPGPCHLSGHECQHISYQTDSRYWPILG